MWPWRILRLSIHVYAMRQRVTSINGGARDLKTGKNDTAGSNDSRCKFLHRCACLAQAGRIVGDRLWGRDFQAIRRTRVRSGTWRQQRRQSGRIPGGRVLSGVGSRGDKHKSKSAANYETSSFSICMAANLPRSVRATGEPVLLSKSSETFMQPSSACRHRNR